METTDRSAESKWMTREESEEREKELRQVLEAFDFEVTQTRYPPYSGDYLDYSSIEIRGYFKPHKSTTKVIFDTMNNTPSEQEPTGNVAEHATVCKELLELYARKNHDYGDSFHLTYQKWGLTMSAIRLEDKLQRFEKLIRSDSEVKDESIRDTLIDLANYSIMTVMELDKNGKS